MSGHSSSRSPIPEPCFGTLIWTEESKSLKDEEAKVFLLGWPEKDNSDISVISGKMSSYRPLSRYGQYRFACDWDRYNNESVNKSEPSLYVPRSGVDMSELRSNYFAYLDFPLDQRFFNNLAKLPPEILSKIFETVSPLTLTILEQCGGKVQTASLAVRMGNFRQHRIVMADELERFVFPRCHTLEELYLDDMTYLSPVLIFKIVEKCDNLRVLSVKNCPCPVFALFRHISSLKLEDLSFTVFANIKEILGEPDKCDDIQLKSLFATLKMLSIKVVNISKFFDICTTIFGFCDNLIGLNITITCQKMILNNLFLGDHVLTPLPDLPNLCHLSIVWPFTNKYSLQRVCQWKCEALLPFLEWTFTKRKECQLWKTFWITDISNRLDVWKACRVTQYNLSSASCLFLGPNLYTLGDTNTLELCQPDSISQLGLYVPRFVTNDATRIQRAGGKKLNYLTLCSSSGIVISLSKFDAFDQLLRTCSNIQDLDISGIHVTNSQCVSLCPSISHLKYLRRLCVPICAIMNLPTRGCVRCFKKNEILMSLNTLYPIRRQCNHSEGYIKATEAFRHMVRSCKHVEEFCLSGCYIECLEDEEEIFCDDVIGDTYLWIRLRHVTLERMSSLHYWVFFRLIVLRCQNFSSLHMIDVDLLGQFVYLKEINHILFHARNFQYLRLEHKNCSLMDRVFWAAFKQANSMRGFLFVSNHAARHPILYSANYEYSHLMFMNLSWCLYVLKQIPEIPEIWPSNIQTYRHGFDFLSPSAQIFETCSVKSLEMKSLNLDRLEQGFRIQVMKTKPTCFMVADIYA